MTGRAIYEPFVGLVPHAYAREFRVLAVEGADGGVDLLHSETTPGHALHNTGVRLGCPTGFELVGCAELVAEIDAAYRGSPGGAEVRADGIDPGGDLLERFEADRDADLFATAGKSECAKFLDAVLFEAIDRGASDVHLHPCEDETLVRFRTDGVLADGHRLARGATASVVSRLKVLGGMDTSESRSPQDGRATVTLGRRGAGVASVDLRISTIPTESGERAVIRVLDTARGERLGDLDSIGMPDDVRVAYRRVTNRPNGMVLLTGPTGSGKTTTLYATLRGIGGRSGGAGAVGGGGLNIMTVEDPVEYRLSMPGVTISQSQVNRKKGMSFASGLRHILRQDPDVVMVGEIRDTETARLAIQASLTGHLVFSTLHTNDAVGAPPRLVDLGAEPYLVSSALTAVLAQRLVRMPHGACSGAGCETCHGSGYRGRTGIFELFLLDEVSRELISTGGSAGALRRHAARMGMRSLRADGFRLVADGVTTRGEVERVTVDLCDAVGADGGIGDGHGAGVGA